jgi:SH3-like domain-containing protein
MLKHALLATSATVFIVTSTVTHADFLSGIRDLKNAVSDITSSTQEVSSLTKDLGLNGNEATASPEGLVIGDVLSAKINKLKVFEDPIRDSNIISEINKDNDLIFMGEEVNDFYHVTTDDGSEGWVQKVLVSKR